ncbi:hypothetical protein ACLIL3_010775 [Acinetobacter radioresistens]|uniref:hypothetical protein n=1 Tax=Acinetobacter radioresistens TaxID=40216 RepID=UPI0021CDD2B5|nr:hypothetical protein [Acinetobacter radioresistens]MCU4596848.1 hypothetical protein [Acinetobacter radioresistens]
MEILYNVEVTQGKRQPILEPDIYNEESLLFYLNRFGVEEHSKEYERLVRGEKVLIATYQNEPMAVRLVRFFMPAESQLQLVKILKVSAVLLVLIAFAFLIFLNNFKFLIILLPNALLLWLTSKKLEITSSDKFEKLATRVLIMLGISMLVFSIVALIII